MEGVTFASDIRNLRKLLWFEQFWWSCYFRISLIALVWILFTVLRNY